jgi:hypothetical protein
MTVRRFLAYVRPEFGKSEPADSYLARKPRKFSFRLPPWNIFRNNLQIIFGAGVPLAGKVPGQGEPVKLRIKTPELRHCVRQSEIFKTVMYRITELLGAKAGVGAMRILRNWPF